MSSREFLKDLGVEPTNELVNHPKIKQLIKYLDDNNTYSVIFEDYIDPEKFLYFIDNMNSIKNIAVLMRQSVFELLFPYDYEKFIKLYNIYDAEIIPLHACTEVLYDEEYLKFASKEWTQEVFVNSKKIVRLYKNRIVIKEYNVSPDSLEYISPFEQNLYTLKKAKKEGKLGEVITRAIKAF